MSHRDWRSRLRGGYILVRPARSAPPPGRAGDRVDEAALPSVQPLPGIAEIGVVAGQQVQSAEGERDGDGPCGTCRQLAKQRARYNDEMSFEEALDDQWTAKTPAASRDVVSATLSRCL